MTRSSLPFGEPFCTRPPTGKQTGNYAVTISYFSISFLPSSYTLPFSIAALQRSSRDRSLSPISTNSTFHACITQIISMSTEEETLISLVLSACCHSCTITQHALPGRQLVKSAARASAWIWYGSHSGYCWWISGRRFCSYVPCSPGQYSHSRCFNGEASCCL